MTKNEKYVFAAAVLAAAGIGYYCGYVAALGTCTSTYTTKIAVEKITDPRPANTTTNTAVGLVTGFTLGLGLSLSSPVAVPVAGAALLLGGIGGVCGFFKKPDPITNKEMAINVMLFVIAVLNMAVTVYSIYSSVNQKPISPSP